MSQTDLAESDADRRRAVLRRFMDERGLSVNGWAEASGISEGTLRNFLKGLSNSLTVATYEDLARGANTTVTQLLGLGGFVMVQLRFYVGAGSEVLPLDEPLDYVEGPEGTIAAQVSGDSMFPVYRSGHLIFFSEDEATDPKFLLGEECVVELDDGRRFIKLLAKGGEPDLYTLRSYNAPDIPDVRVVRAAAVQWVDRRRSRRSG